MNRNEEFASKYKSFMSEYETLGHMYEIWDKNENSGYYTPHHGVMSSTKFRVVFNASAKTTSGISLNEAQLVGEKLQKDLFLILMNFRKYRFGITADIEKMYRQVLVDALDRHYQKILWRSNEKEPVRVFHLKTVTYGQACAPHCAIRALIQCAMDYESQFPRGASIIKNCFYVDDLLTGVDTEKEVELVKKEVSTVLNKGCFHLTKWKTNGNSDEKSEIKNYEEPSVLGLCWDLKNDKFVFKIKNELEPERFGLKEKFCLGSEKCMILMDLLDQ